jgi:putative transposase
MQKLRGRKINDLEFSNFIDIIQVQSKKYLHKKISFVDRFYPSSKMCSKCKNIKEDLSLRDREYNCLKCGLITDRNLNAALNIKYKLTHPLAPSLCKKRKGERSK